jgi:DNA-binding MarR family transcriptional regulator
MNNEVQEEWITMSEAARRLKTTVNKISRMADKGQVQTQKDPYDDRVKLVNYAELYQIFDGGRRLRGRGDK